MPHKTVRDAGPALTARDGAAGGARPTTLDAGAGATVRDTGEAPAPAPHIHVRLPSSLAARFRVQRQFPTMGAEADVLLADDPGAGRQVVLKLYRPGIRPKTEVLEKIAGAAPEHVIRLYDYGQAEDVWFEVLEYAAHGSVRDLLRGPVPPAQAHAILDELQQALVHLHARNIIHRDLKPENILVRSVFPLDLILSDFGIASVIEHSQRLTSASRTIRYAAPEAASGLITPKVDYWSLGMILVEALNGHHPFEAMSDAVIVNWLSTRPVDVSGVKDGAWNALCRGLLHRDPSKRWGADEVGSWLEGARPAVAADEQPPPGLAPPSEVTAVRPYSVGREQCRTLAELGEALARHWDEGVKHLSRNLILAWVRDDLRDQSLASYLMDLADERDLHPNERLLRFIVRIAPQLPPVYKGRSLAEEDLLTLARQAIQGDSGARDFLWEVYEWDVLGCFTNESARATRDVWREAVQLYEGLAQQVSATGKSEPTPDAKTCLPAILLARWDRSFREALMNSPATHEQLYRFVCAVDADLPRVYKGRSLAVENLLALTHQATEGDDAARDILWEVYDRDVLGGFADESARAQRDGWREAVQLYESLASQVSAIGRNEADPWLKTCLPAILLARWDRSFREALMNSPATHEQLYRFVCAVDADLPRVYKGRSLAVENLLALAHQATKGDDAARDFLWEVYKRDVLWCFAGESARAQRDGWREAVQLYESLASQLSPSAKMEPTPDAKTCLPAILLARWDRSFRETLIKAPATHEQLYRFVCAVDPGLPPMYKGWSLSVNSLLTLAHQALEGKTYERGFLWELYQQDVLACFADESLRAFREKWREAAAGYEDGRKTIFPASARPALKEQMPVLLLTLFIDQVRPDVVTLLSRLKDSKRIESQTKLDQADQLFAVLSSWHPEESMGLAAAFRACKEALSSAHDNHNVQTYVRFLYAITLAEGVISSAQTLQSSRINELQNKVRGLIDAAKARLPESGKYSKKVEREIKRANDLLSQFSAPLSRVSYESFTAALSVAQAAEATARSAEEKARARTEETHRAKKRGEMTAWLFSVAWRITPGRTMGLWLTLAFLFLLIFLFFGTRKLP